MGICLYSTDTDPGLVSVIGRSGSYEFKIVSQIPVGNAPCGEVKFTKNGPGYVSNLGYKLCYE